MAADPGTINVQELLSNLHARVRERLRGQLAAEAGAGRLDDPVLFAEVEAVLATAAATSETVKLLLPELLGESESWRLSTSMQYDSHRGRGVARLFLFVKRRILLPAFRWLFEYSRDNFERQRRTNHVIFACLQELALQNAELRRELHRLADSQQPSARR